MPTRSVSQSGRRTVCVLLCTLLALSLCACAKTDIPAIPSESTQARVPEAPAEAISPEKLTVTLLPDAAPAPIDTLSGGITAADLLNGRVAGVADTPRHTVELTDPAIISALIASGDAVQSEDGSLPDTVTVSYLPSSDAAAENGGLLKTGRSVQTINFRDTPGSYTDGFTNLVSVDWEIAMASGTSGITPEDIETAVAATLGISADEVSLPWQEVMTEVPDDSFVYTVVYPCRTGVAFTVSCGNTVVADGTVWIPSGYLVICEQAAAC